MPDLTTQDFAPFFKAIHGYDPFHWQAALAARVMGGGGWPSTIDVPTGMGKTALLDIAVFALAAQAHRPAANRTAPTRTFMVVDRRVIVDQAYDRATALQKALATATEGVVKRVGDALRRISGADCPLEVVRMRGGVTWGWRWLQSPDRPAIVVGTVDQYGSRLLFRGYGVGPHLRPIDAALAGTDRLLLLDEAHMSQPLVHTSLTVHRYEGVSERPVLAARRPPPIQLSATLPSQAPDAFSFDPDAEASDTARARLDAVKRTALVDLATRAKDPSADLARAMADVALDRAQEEAVDRVVVVCNTVRVARAVFANVACEGDAVEPVLMIGRCREVEREEIVRRWGSELRASPGARRAREKPLVVVATQTVEVGADFDFDAMVSEAAPLDALLQRLGRLDRLGRLGKSRATVIWVASRHGDDPVYGEATRRTWAWLVEVAGTPAPTPPRGVVEAARAGPTLDLGSMAVRRALSPEVRAGLASDRAVAPEIIGPMLAAWARTSPVPEPDQSVAAFLHGVGRGVPEVLVCWRAGLPAAGPVSREIWEAELQSAPVSSAECVSVPLWEARRFLDGASPGDMADVEGVLGDEDPFDERVPVPAVIRAPDGSLLWKREQLRPGSTVVVPSESGGHDEWGWTGVAGGRSVPDIADFCRRRATLRLRPALLAHLLGGQPGEWDEKVGRPGTDLDESSTAPRDDVAVDRALAAIALAGTRELSPLGQRVVVRARELGALPRRRSVRVAEEWFMVTAPRGPLVEEAGDEMEGSSSAAHRAIGLDEHLRDVARRAAEVAGRIGLPADLAAAVELAGLAHDLGKADRRFQAMLHRGDLRRAEVWPELLAKSGMDPADRTAFREARRASKLPAGMRHEAGSAALLARMADAQPSLTQGVDLELVLHLVASHHGRGRPLLPPVADNDPVDVMVSLPGYGLAAQVRSNEGVIDWDGPSRFQRLGRRYGWWGLALLEAVIRLADIECSEGYGRETSS